MATRPKKGTTSRSAAGATRGRKLNAAVRKAAKTPASRHSRAAGPVKAPARKTSRKQAAPSTRTTRTTAAIRGKRTSTELATQFERISHDLEDLRGLRTEMQELRAGFEAFARQIETLLRPHRRSAEEPQAVPPAAANESSFETPRQGSFETAEEEEEEDTVEPASALD